MLRLACDGPHNGQYIDGPTAVAAGYASAEWPTGEMSAEWPTGEIVWMQPSVLMDQWGVDERGNPA